MTDPTEDNAKKLVCDWCSRIIERTTAIIRGGEKDNVCSICTRAYYKGYTVGRRVGKEYVQAIICDALGVVRKE